MNRRDITSAWRAGDRYERVLVFVLCPIVTVIVVVAGAWPIASALVAAQLGWIQYLVAKAKVRDLNSELYVRHLCNQILVRALARSGARPRYRSSIHHPRGHR